jgi:disulfide bond formation protein DsbB
MNLVVEQKVKPSIYPKCPYNRLELTVMRVALVALSTVGLYFLNLYVAVVFMIYSVVYYFWAMPIKHCRFCYYQLRNISLDEWRESFLDKHVACGKKWSPHFGILWFVPIILIGISLFLNFSTIALLSLIGFIAVLVVMGVHMRRSVCPSCAIVDDCHSAF